MPRESLRLVGAHEIRKLIGVSRQRVYQLARRPDFPKPVAKLTQGKIWNLNDVEEWISVERTGREPDPR
ncbi:helix-turn-helix transcriptional regulator [Jidongwangia harbinensis]|uniref:helix-turn-helix transcriptional regulator n=1 Tax=Jidongwangia harbinensis TaxID=2878561 RepID=UPI001CD9E7F1|nr:AlpA family phage regulatory protein [Jidongwangia harbinensis]MCA2216981.1 AlpA family phage regulatory protein [Jidongwangia harbinensis]